MAADLPVSKRQKSSDCLSPIVGNHRTKIPYEYCGRRTLSPDHIPLATHEFDDLFENNPSPNIPFEQDYDQLGLITIQFADDEEDDELGEEGHAGTGRDNTNSTRETTITPSPPPSGQGRALLLEASQKAAEAKKEAAAALKRRRVALLVMPSTMTAMLYGRLSTFCKNRMIYAFHWSPPFKRTIIRDCFGKFPFSFHLFVLLFAPSRQCRGVWLATFWRTAFLRLVNRN